MGIVPSIEMVIYAAVGGRLSLVGAVIGALLVNADRTLFSETFPDLWLFLMAALFIGTTMAFPTGLAGLMTEKVLPWWGRRWSAARTAGAPGDPGASVVSGASMASGASVAPGASAISGGSSASGGSAGDDAGLPPRRGIAEATGG